MRSPQSRNRHRLALYSIGFCVIIIMAIIWIGYIAVFVYPPRQLVVRVNDVEYTRGDLVKLVRARQKGAEFFGGSFNPSSDVFKALQSLIENEMISQAAPRMGIRVTDTLLQKEIDRMMMPPDLSLQGKSEIQIKRELDERYGSFLNTIQFSEKEHRDLVKKSMLKEIFRQHIGESVATVSEQVRLHRIVVGLNDEIDIMNIKFEDAVRDKNNPDDLRAAYKDIVREFSRDDPEIVRNGGDLGWVPKGVHKDYEYRFFDLEMARLSEPIADKEDSNKIFFFMVSERSPSREIEPHNIDKLKTEALQNWLNDERQNHQVHAEFDSFIYEWIIEQLRLTDTLPTPTPDPLKQFLGTQ